jgi:hypothetical protein
MYRLNFGLKTSTKRILLNFQNFQWKVQFKSHDNHWQMQTLKIRQKSADTK